MKFLSVLVLCSSAILTGGKFFSLFAVEEFSPPREINVATILRSAWENNPSIAAARAQWAVKKAESSSAGVWPSPLLSFSRETLPGGGRMDHRKIEQDIPFPGKKTFESRMKRHEAAIVGARYRATALAILSDAGVLSRVISTADETLRLVKSDIETMEAMSRLLQVRWSTGANASESFGAGPDIFLLRAELGRLRNALLDEEKKKRSAVYDLNALLHLPSTTHWAGGAPVSLRELPMSLEAIQAQAERNAPDLMMALHEQNHARVMSSRSLLDWAPDFRFMYDARKDGAGIRGREAGLGVFVPLWVRGSRGTQRAARAHEREAEAQLSSARNDLHRRIATEFAEVETRLAQAKAYQSEILPSMESALRLMRRRYENGGGDFSRYLEILRAALAARREYAEAVNGYAEHWSLLEKASGVALSEETRNLLEEVSRAEHE